MNSSGDRLTSHGTEKTSMGEQDLTERHGENTNLLEPLLQEAVGKHSIFYTDPHQLGRITSDFPILDSVLQRRCES